MKKVLLKVSSNEYQGNGMVLKREYGKTPNGNDLDGRWVLRNDKGDWIGFNTYCSDLAEAHDIILKETNEHS